MLTWQIEFFLFVVTVIDTYLELMGKKVNSGVK